MLSGVVIAVRKTLFMIESLGWTLAPSWTAWIRLLIGLPVMIIEMICISPMIGAAALIESSIEDKGFFRTYMKMWNSVASGSNEPISTPNGVLMAIVAFLTSPLGMWVNMCVFIITILSMAKA